MQTHLFSETSVPVNLLPFEGEVLYFPDLFTPGDSIHFLELLKNNIQWKQEPIKIMGKEIMQPRLTAWYGESEKPYRYSGITMQAYSWTDFLLEIKSKIEDKAQTHFTSVLLNYYRNGEDSMGWHRDNEKELGSQPIIGSVSFGSTRKFQFRPYTGKKPLIDIPLSAGTGLIMKGMTNHFWEHRLPKAPKLISPRINLTFRKIA